MALALSVDPAVPAVDQVDEDALRRLLDPGCGFPSTRDVAAAAALFGRGPRSGWVSGRSTVGVDVRGAGTRTGTSTSLHVAMLHREFFVAVAAGTVAVRMADPMRTERTKARAPLGGHAVKDLVPYLDRFRTRLDRDPVTGEALGWVDADAFYLRAAFDDDGLPVRPTGRTERVITEWTRKSRANMVRALAELDYAPLFVEGRPPAMETLTYPGDWRAVAPSGAAVKAHLQAFLKRRGRAWAVDGKPPPCLWKLEFQRRGAPHLHLFLVTPPGRARCSCKAVHVLDRPDLCRGGLRYREWLSWEWADVVGADDQVLDEHGNTERRRHRLAGTGVDVRQGARMTDPKRLAVYFSKHGGAAGGKEYQHRVPVEWQHPDRGPGRFWGYRGLARVRQEAHVDVEAYVRVRRTLRRLSRSRRLTATFTVDRGPVRADPETGEVRRSRRRVRRRRVQMRGGGMTGGFLVVNDGPALAAALSRV